MCAEEINTKDQERPSMTLMKRTNGDVMRCEMRMIMERMSGSEEAWEGDFVETRVFDLWLKQK